MGIVTLDVVALLANVFIQLIACELHQSDEPWVEAVTSGLEVAALVFSSLFMIELGACLFAFGFRCAFLFSRRLPMLLTEPRYLATPFHLFDSAVIVLSFVIDVASRGLAESIGSLVVILRLWRLAKISEEVVMGATERLEILEQQMDDLELENKSLRERLGIESHEHSGQE